MSTQTTTTPTSTSSDRPIVPGLPFTRPTMTGTTTTVRPGSRTASPFPLGAL